MSQCARRQRDAISGVLDTYCSGSVAKLALHKIVSEKVNTRASVSLVARMFVRGKKTKLDSQHPTPPAPPSFSRRMYIHGAMVFHLIGCVACTKLYFYIWRHQHTPYSYYIISLRQLLRSLSYLLIVSPKAVLSPESMPFWCGFRVHSVIE